MKNKKVSLKNRFIILISCLALQACLDSDLDSKISENSSDESSSCIETSGDAIINGASVSAKGEKASFSIPKSDCSQNFFVSWKTNDGYIGLSDGEEFTHTYRNPGIYNLEAVLIDSTGNSKKITKKVVVKKECEEDSSCLALEGPEVAVVDKKVSFDLLSDGLSDRLSDAPKPEWKATDEEGEILTSDDGSFDFKDEGKVTVIATVDEEEIKKEVVIVKKEIEEILLDGSSEEECNIEGVSLSGPSELHINESVKAKVELPKCLSDKLKGISWTFSDGQDAQYSQEIDLKFIVSGNYTYSVDLLFEGEEEIKLSRSIEVSDEECADCEAEVEIGGDLDTDPLSSDFNPEGDGILADDESSNKDGSGLVDGPLSCGAIPHGTEILIENLISGASVSCGSENGNKVVTSSVKRVRTCVNGSYVESNKDAEIVSETACFKWVNVGATTCTAACGGVQQDIYACKGDGVEVSDGNFNLCGEKPDTSAYSCDADPNFEEIRVTETLDKGEPRVCNSNRTGYIVDKETTREIYRCVDHSITLVDTVVTLEEAPFCLDLKRCSHDGLSPSKAHGRLEWMKKCSSNDKIKKFLEETDEFRFAPQNSYSINADGTRFEGRPTYITFQNKNGSVWVAPAPGTSNWRERAITDLNDVSEASCEIPNDVEIAGICTSSCVTPTQRILTKSGETDMFNAHRSSLSEVMSLSPLSTVLRPVLQSSPVMQFITEVMNTEHDIRIFKMASGKSIEYTPNHPVIDKEGKLKEAGDFIVGEHFVRKSGELDEILQIKSVKYFGKVYNVYMKSSLKENNVVVINDYLTGSAHFQQEGHELVDRKILRSSLVK